MLRNNLLPRSLNDLASSFSLDHKFDFPHKFASADTLNYIGPAPSSQFYYHTPAKPFKTS